MIVLDASLAIEVLLRTARGMRHADRVLNSHESLHVPHLLDVEVLHVLRRFTFAGELDPRRAESALITLIDLPLIRHGHTAFMGRIWELRRSLTAYDAAYIALAEALSAALLTCDARLARSQGHHARVELLT